MTFTYCFDGYWYEFFADYDLLRKTLAKMIFDEYFYKIEFSETQKCLVIEALNSMIGGCDLDDAIANGWEDEIKENLRPIAYREFLEQRDME